MSGDVMRSLLTSSSGGHPYSLCYAIVSCFVILCNVSVLAQRINVFLVPEVEVLMRRELEQLGSNDTCETPTLTLTLTLTITLTITLTQRRELEQLSSNDT
jgi:hypothetical protein